MDILGLIALAKSQNGGSASKVFHFKGVKSATNLLPIQGEEGDVYKVEGDSYYAWDGTDWVDIGEVLSVDEAEELISGLASDVDDLKSSFDSLEGGTTGQVLRKKSDTDFDVEWASVAAPTDAQVETAVTDWLDDHPEATTTVEDGAITPPKLDYALSEAVEMNANAEILGLHGYATEALARADASGYSANNTTVLQTALNSGKIVIIGMGFYPIADEVSLPLSFTIKGINKYDSCFVFPESRGFVFDRAGYYSNFAFEDFSIISHGSCITARNGTNRPVPENIYQGTFSRLYLKCETENCVESSYMNRGAVGNQLYFEIKFDEITVTALEGDGFVDIFGLGIVFSKCNDRSSIRYVFRNCTGKWVDVNITFAGAEYFLYFDDSFGAYTNSLEFYDCNSETTQKGFIGYDESNRLWGIQTLLMINQGISAIGTNRQYPMVNLPRVERIISVGGEYSSYPSRYDTSVVKAVFHIWEKPSSYNIFDKELDEYITRFSYVCKNDRIISFNNKLTTYTDGGYYLNVPKHEQIEASLIYGQRVLSSVTLTNITYSAVNLKQRDNCAIDRVEFDFTANQTAIYVDIGNRETGRIITFYNNNTGVITLGSADTKYESADYPCTFESLDGNKTITLNRYESATFVLKAKDIGANKAKIYWKQIA